MTGNAPAAVDLAALQTILGDIVAPWVRDLGLSLTAAKPGEITLSLPVASHLVHGGGVLCGQALMAAANTAMVLAISSQLGGFKPMTTVQMNTSFLRPVAGDSGQASVIARVLRMGKNLVFGEIEVFEVLDEAAARSQPPSR